MTRQSFVSLLVSGLLLLSGWCWPLSAHAQSELGRLFTTPAERKALDRLRLEAQFARPAPEPAPPPATSPAPQQPAGPVVSRLEVNGIVRRSGGPATVWVNGAQVERGMVSREGLRVQSAGRPADGVRVRLPSGLSTVRLKPGQAVDVTTGSLVDAYEPRPAVQGSSGLELAPPAPEQPTETDAPVSETGGNEVLPESANSDSVATPRAPERRRLSHQQLRELSRLPAQERAAALTKLRSGGTEGTGSPRQ